MLGALRAVGVVVDVADRFEVARAAVGAALDRAVGRELARDRAGEVLLEELLRQARVEVVPRQRLAERTAAQVERGVDAVRGERLFPERMRQRSDQPSKRAPRACAVSITSASRRSPAAKTPSSHDKRASCHLNSMPRRRSSWRSNAWRACVSSTESSPAHWNGVCGFGENVDTLAVTASRPPAARFTRSASSAMPRRRLRSRSAGRS
jgi:hypothetical protein